MKANNFEEASGGNGNAASQDRQKKHNSMTPLS